MKKYINLIKLFFTLFKMMRDPSWQSFANRKLGVRKSFGLLKRPLENRFQSDIKGKNQMSQKDLFLYLAITAFEEPEEELKEELLLPFLLLFTIYCAEKDSE